MANVQEGPFMRIKAVVTDKFGYSVDRGGTIRKWDREDMTAKASASVDGKQTMFLAFGSNDVLYAAESETGTGGDIAHLYSFNPSDLSIISTRNFGRLRGLAFGYDGNLYAGTDTNTSGSDAIPVTLFKLDPDDLSTLGSVSLGSKTNDGGIKSITHFDGFAYALFHGRDGDFDPTVTIHKVDTSTMSVVATYDDSASRRFEGQYGDRIAHDNEGFVYAIMRLIATGSEPAGHRLIRVATDTMSLSASTEGDTTTGGSSRPDVTWKTSDFVYSLDGDTLSEFADATLAKQRTIISDKDANGLTWSTDDFLFRGTQDDNVEKIDIDSASITATLSDHSREILDIAIDETVQARIPIPAA